MAKKAPVTSPTESTLNFPSIVVPCDAKIDEWGVDFDLGVGPSKICFHWRRDKEIWQLDGSTSAMLTLGLLRPEWMPGLPGNNITSQIVVFNENGPSLIHGNLRGARKGKSWLQIYRNSRITTFVSYTPPLDQRQQLNIAVDEVRARRQTEVKSTTASASYKSQSPGEFRHDWLKMVDMAWDLNQGRSRECGFSFNKESTERINRAFGEFRRAITEGGVQAKPALHRDGNVIYLGAQSAVEVTP
jgi:hypothetical protein